MTRTKPPPKPGTWLCNVFGHGYDWQAGTTRKESGACWIKSRGKNKKAAPDAPTPETAKEIESMDIVAKMKGDVKREND